MRPQVRAVAAIHQLGHQPQAIAGASDASLDEIAHTQSLGELLCRIRPPFHGEGRTPGHDGKAAEAAQCCNELVDDAVSKILLIRIVAQILERQYSKRWNACVGGCGDGSQQSIAYPRHGDDPLLPVISLAERLPQCSNLHREVAFFDGDSWPARVHQVGLADWPVSFCHGDEQSEATLSHRNGGAIASETFFRQHKPAECRRGLPHDLGL